MILIGMERFHDSMALGLSFRWTTGTCTHTSGLGCRTIRGEWGEAQGVQKEVRALRNIQLWNSFRVIWR
jgi:hypothetical protein